MSDEPKKENLFFVRPAPGATKESFAKDMAKNLIAEINAARIKAGLPPLEKDVED